MWTFIFAYSLNLTMSSKEKIPDVIKKICTGIQEVSKAKSPTKEAMAMLLIGAFY